MSCKHEQREMLPPGEHQSNQCKPCNEQPVTCIGTIHMPSTAPSVPWSILSPELRSREPLNAKSCASQQMKGLFHTHRTTAISELYSTYSFSVLCMLAPIRSLATDIFGSNLSLTNTSKTTLIKIHWTHVCQYYPVCFARHQCIGLSRQSTPYTKYSYMYG